MLTLDIGVLFFRRSAMLDFWALSQTLPKTDRVALPIECSLDKIFKKWREKLLAICMVRFINTFYAIE